MTWSHQELFLLTMFYLYTVSVLNMNTDSLITMCQYSLEYSHHLNLCYQYAYMLNAVRVNVTLINYKFLYEISR